MRCLFVFAVVLATCLGCVDSEVSANDADKNIKEFSQDSYEQAMIKAGRGKELEEEKKRNAEHMSGSQGGGQQ